MIDLWYPEGATPLDPNELGGLKHTGPFGRAL
ncbi:hypothetical protein ACVW1A_001587 [Bradyrhizobium sp. LB1.3]